MKTIKITAHVDEDHRLNAELPSDIQSGPVEVLVLIPSLDEDEGGTEWASGVAREWNTELADPREDIHSLADGEPVDAAG